MSTNVSPEGARSARCRPAPVQSLSEAHEPRRRDPRCGGRSLGQSIGGLGHGRCRGGFIGEVPTHYSGDPFLTFQHISKRLPQSLRCEYYHYRIALRMRILTVADRAPNRISATSVPIITTRTGCERDGSVLDKTRNAGTGLALRHKLLVRFDLHLPAG